MPEETFGNSMATSGGDEAWIESGTIANVNVKNMTVDWVSQYSGKHIPDLQIMTPYLHYNNGEGFTCVPEVGAIAMVCFPSDEESPFVLGFVSGPEMEGADSGDLQTKIEDPDVETEEDLPAAQTTQSGGSTSPTTNPSDASFRAGRPILNPGDMLWQGRDENWVILRRGGVLQLGATQICQRAYIPVLNFIRDFCENWEMNTAAGTLSWEVKRQENDPSGDAPTELALIAREHAQDKKASIKVLIGSLDDADKPPGGDKTFIEVTIAPESIEADSGKVSGTPKYVLRLDKAGNSYMMQAAKRTVEIKGDDEITVKGNQKIDVKGNREVTIGGNSKHTITGTHEVTGTATSKETWGGGKVIAAPTVQLGPAAGGGAVEGVPLGLKLVQWLTTHFHAVAAVPAPTPSAVIPTLPVSGHPSTKSFVDTAQTIVSKTVSASQ